MFALTPAIVPKSVYTLLASRTFWEAKKPAELGKPLHILTINNSF
jgi:hypothetical protein